MDTLHVSKLAEGTEKGNRHFARSFYFHSTHSLFSQRKITLYLDSQLGGHGKEKEALTWNDRMAFFFFFLPRLFDQQTHTGHKRD